MLKRNIVSYTFQIADNARSCKARRERLKPRSGVYIYFRRFLFNPHDDRLEAVQVQGVFFLQDGQELPQAWLLVTLNVSLKPSVLRFYKFVVLASPRSMVAWWFQREAGNLGSFGPVLSVVPGNVPRSNPGPVATPEKTLASSITPRRNQRRPFREREQ
ncbi:unnamed protein product [Ixodes persulcatus]